ncbi:MAG: thioredoxin family protein [Bdellovibrionota bacterium]
MALTYSPPGELGSQAPDFSLIGTDGKTYSLKDFAHAKSLVVVFMCNHCPYVQAVRGRINALAKEFAPRGLKLIGINSNDVVEYPEDDFEAMKREVLEQGYEFPYLWDETQSVARAYGAVCTPDFYVYSPDKGAQVLRYRGRFDDQWKDESKVKVRDLAQAVQQILSGAPVNPKQPASMGCSIKWK